MYRLAIPNFTRQTNHAKIEALGFKDYYLFFDAPLIEI